MIVNYYDIHRCECVWDQDVPLLVAPENTAEQLLKMRGFYCGEDGKWYKQLSKQEALYLYSRRNMLVVDLPENDHASSYDAEESNEDKKKATLLSIISMLLMYGAVLFNFLLYKKFDINTLPISVLSIIVGIIMGIYVDVRYPKKSGNGFKRLSIVFEEILVLIVISIFSMCNSCMTDCRGCSV